jgi:hypothetical protein
MTVEAPFDPDELRKLLLGLGAQQRLAFGLACSERLYPNYVVFADEQGWGEPKTLRAALDLAWDAVLGQPPSPALLRQLQKESGDNHFMLDLAEDRVKVGPCAAPESRPWTYR